MTNHSRKKKLIKPALQLKLAGIFMASALAVISIQAFTLHKTTMALSGYLPNDQALFKKLWPDYFLQNTVLAGLLILVAMFGVGIAVTFRIAGPIYRFENYLRDLRDGKATAPCSLRSGDDLKGICDLLNEATEPIRAQNAARQAEAPADTTRQAA